MGKGQDLPCCVTKTIYRSSISDHPDSYTIIDQSDNSTLTQKERMLHFPLDHVKQGSSSAAS